MPVPAGFGVNYSAPQAQWARDKAYFKAIKNPNSRFGIRVHSTSIPNPYVSGDPSIVGSDAYWRSCAAYFAADPAFEVTWGVGGPVGLQRLTVNTGNMDQTLWNAFHDSVVQEATYFQSIGFAIDFFEIGNELEINCNNTTFTWQNCRDALKQLVIDVKAVYTLGKISYGCNCGVVTDGNGSSCWVAEGLGSFDAMSIHPYTIVNSPTNIKTVNVTDKYVPQFAPLGAQGYVSEFNLSIDNGLYDTLTPATIFSQMPVLYNSVKTFNRFYVFQWVGKLGVYDSLAQLRPNGTMNPAWITFFDSSPMYYTSRSAVSTPRASVSRSSVSRSPATNRVAIFT